MKKNRDMLKKLNMEEEFDTWKKNITDKRVYYYKDFKVGDKVRYVDEKSGSPFLNSIGTVISIDAPTSHDPEGFIHVQIGLHGSDNEMVWYPFRLRPLR
jgi:hypothetical protein